MKHIVSRMSSYFPNRWPLSYLNLTKNMKTYIRRQQHKKKFFPFSKSMVDFPKRSFLFCTNYKFSKHQNVSFFLTCRSYTQSNLVKNGNNFFFKNMQFFFFFSLPQNFSLSAPLFNLLHCTGLLLKLTKTYVRNNN